MKILVFSDSHGDSERMKYVIDRVHPDAEYVLHLGDFEMDAESLSEEYPRKTFVTVTGNCDRYFRYVPSASLTRTLDINGLRIYMCHGDRAGVKSTGDAVLSVIAAEKRADIVLYGHTHAASVRTVTVAATQREALERMAELPAIDGGEEAEKKLIYYGSCAAAQRGVSGSGKVIILNPGSISSPRGESAITNEPSYATVETGRQGEYTVRIFTAPY